MAKPYLEKLLHLVEQLKTHSDQLDNVECRHFFSGAAAFVDGEIFMSLSPVGLALKLPEKEIKTLFGQGAKPLQYFQKSPIKKDYAVLPTQIVDDHKALTSWVLQSIHSALK